MSRNLVWNKDGTAFKTADLYMANAASTECVTIRSIPLETNPSNTGSWTSTIVTSNPVNCVESKTMGSKHDMM